MIVVIQLSKLSPENETCKSGNVIHCSVYLIDLPLSQIDDGEIHASINQRDGMVVFLDNPEKYNSPTMMAHLDKEVSVAI